MREIKFRYWNGVSNIMVNNPQMPYKKGWSIEQLFSDRGWVWQQYTGLKDKNGKEIYDGDIVITPQQSDIKQWVIEYDCDGNIILSNQLNSELCLYDFEDMVVNKNNQYVKDIEVIGNIYENKDLIN